MLIIFSNEFLRQQPYFSTIIATKNLQSTTKMHFFSKKHLIFKIICLSLQSNYTYKMSSRNYNIISLIVVLLLVNYQG